MYSKPKVPKPNRETIENYRKWFDARDIFCGRANRSFDFAKALELAKTSNHRDAVWFCSLFSDGMSDNNEILHILYTLKNDRRALCFYGLLANDWNLLKQSVELQYYYGRDAVNCNGIVFDMNIGEELEPRMLYKLAEYYKSDPTLQAEARDFYKLAAELGYVQAMFEYGLFLDEDDPERYKWLAKAAQRDYQTSLYSAEVYKQYGKYCSNIYYNSDDDNGKTNNINKILFQIGHLNVIYHKDNTMEKIRKLYNQWCNKAKDAVFCWMLIAKRLPIHKDLRKIIAHFVWNMRSDADYNIDD